MGLFSKKDPAEKYCSKALDHERYNKPEKALYYYRKAIDLGSTRAMGGASSLLYQRFPHTRENLEQAVEWWRQYMLSLPPEKRIGRQRRRNISTFYDTTEFEEGYGAWAVMWAELCKLLEQPWGCGTMEKAWKEMLALLASDAEREATRPPHELTYQAETFLTDLYLKGKHVFPFHQYCVDLRELCPSWMPDEEKGLYWLHKALEKYQKANAPSRSAETPTFCALSALEYLMEKTPRDYQTALPYLCYFFQERFQWNAPERSAEMAQCLADYYREIGDSKNAEIWEYNRDGCRHNAEVDKLNDRLDAVKHFHAMPYAEYDKLRTNLQKLGSNIDFSSNDLEERRKELESMEQDE